MKFNSARIFTVISALGFLAGNTVCAGEITAIEAEFQGSSIPIGGSGVFQYNFVTTNPVADANVIRFQSRFKFYTGFSASGGVAQLFRRNTDYSVRFQVNDPDQIGYNIKIHRRVIGRSSIQWTGTTSGNASTGSVGYDSGLVRVNGVLKTGLQLGNFVSREVSKGNPSPEDEIHQVDREVIIRGFKGTQIFTMSEHEAAAQIVNVFQNHNTGSAQLFFGMAPDGTGYSISQDDSGDTFEFTVIFNPQCALVSVTPGAASVAFRGILQECDDSMNWVDVKPQPTSPAQIQFNGSRRFFRARSVE